MVSLDTSRVELKDNARKLRSKGFSYNEIYKELSVPKSTLSYWLRGIELTKKQKLRLIKKGTDNHHLGSEAIKRQRIERTRKIVEKAISEVKLDVTKDLWLIGIILYWAEGHKQKEHNPSMRVVFSNSDPRMIRLFIKWLKQYLLISDDYFILEIYIHRSYKKTRKILLEYWSNVTGISEDHFTKIRYKKNKINSYRKNRGDNYYGVLRIGIRKSTDLNRKITGWIEGICLQCGIV